MMNATKPNRFRTVDVTGKSTTYKTLVGAQRWQRKLSQCNPHLRPIVIQERDDFLAWRTIYEDTCYTLRGDAFIEGMNLKFGSVAAAQDWMSLRQIKWPNLTVAVWSKKEEI